MHKVKIHEAKTHLSRLIQEALDGEEVIIARGDRPLVRLDVLPEARGERVLGGARGLIIEWPEDFDEPLEDFREYMNEPSA